MKHGTYLIVACLIGMCAINKASAQSLTGTTGLLFSPTAEMQDDGTFVLGTSYFSKRYLSYGDYQFDAMAGYVNLTFLPFLEVSFRYTYRFEEISDETRYFPDRMPSIRLRLIKEKKNIPSIVLGIHDFSSTDTGFFGARYLVFTKNIGINDLVLQPSLGYGSKTLLVDDSRIKNLDFIGVFGGINVSHEKVDWLSWMLEYDSRYWNTGLRFFFFDRLQVMTVLRNMSTFEGNITYKIPLK